MNWLQKCLLSIRFFAASKAGPQPTLPSYSPSSTEKSTPEPSIMPKAAESKPNLLRERQWKPDPRSQRAIDGLEPLTAKLATEHLRRLAAEGLNFKVTSGTRTMAEQAALYAQGRTAAGAVVTKARPGYSWHNFGVAYDLTLFSGRNPVWESPKYLRAGQIGKELGLEWGGEWRTFKDIPHFQRPMGVTLTQARAKWPTGMVA